MKTCLALDFPENGVGHLNGPASAGNRAVLAG